MLFKTFCFKRCIEHRRIAAYRANGNYSERSIQNLVCVLKAYYHSNQTGWDSELGYIQSSVNTAKNESTRYTPFELMFYHKVNNGLSNLWKLHDFISHNNLEQSKLNLARAIQNVKKSVQRNRNRTRFSDKNVKHPFKTNSLVLIKLIS